MLLVCPVGKLAFLQKKEPATFQLQGECHEELGASCLA